MVVYKYPFMANAPDFDQEEPGIVLSVDVWKDPAKPKNTGVNVKVKWAFTGAIHTYEPDELEIVSSVGRPPPYDIS